MFRQAAARSPQELDWILADLQPEDLGGYPESVPDPPTVAVTACGDLWILGRHRMLCGDSLVDGNAELVLGGQTVAITFCDPLQLQLHPTQQREEDQH
jgi:hypothetical protein